MSELFFLDGDDLTDLKDLIDENEGVLLHSDDNVSTPFPPSADTESTSLEAIIRLPHSQPFLEHLDLINQEIIKGRPAKPTPKDIETESKLFAESNRYVQEITDEINRIHKYITTIYDEKFADLKVIISNPYHYALICRTIGNSSTLDTSQFSKLLPQTLIMSLKLTSSLSTHPLPEEKMKQVLAGCDTIISLEEQKNTLQRFIESRIQFIAPNLSNLVSPPVAAQLVSAAGGLNNLARTPACNILTMGTGRQATGIGTSLGLVQQSFISRAPIVNETDKEHRIKAIRVLAGRFDFSLHLLSSPLRFLLFDIISNFFSFSFFLSFFLFLSLSLFHSNPVLLSLLAQTSEDNTPLGMLVRSTKQKSADG